MIFIYSFLNELNLLSLYKLYYIIIFFFFREEKKLTLFLKIEINFTYEKYRDVFL